MASKAMEKVLNANHFVEAYDLEIDRETNTYTLDVDFASFMDSEDASELLKLKNAVRAQLNKSFKIKWVIRFV